jgi:hypothetical protein
MIRQCKTDHDRPVGHDHTVSRILDRLISGIPLRYDELYLLIGETFTTAVKD